MSLAGSDEIDALTGRIIGCAIRVHRRFGPGLFERPYNRAMALELRKSQLRHETEVSVRATYDDRDMGVCYKMDFIVDRWSWSKSKRSHDSYLFTDNN
jgi:GxxExxY protein